MSFSNGFWTTKLVFEDIVAVHHDVIYICLSELQIAQSLVQNPLRERGAIAEAHEYHIGDFQPSWRDNRHLIAMLRSDWNLVKEGRAVHDGDRFFTPKFGDDCFLCIVESYTNGSAPYSRNPRAPAGNLPTYADGQHA